MNPQGALVVGAAWVTTPLIPKPARRRRGPPRPPTSPNRRSPPSEPRREPSAVEGGGGRGGGLVARCSVSVGCLSRLSVEMRWWCRCGGGAVEAWLL